MVSQFAEKTANALAEACKYKVELWGDLHELDAKDCDKAWVSSEFAVYVLIDKIWHMDRCVLSKHAPTSDNPRNRRLPADDDELILMIENGRAQT